MRIWGTSPESIDEAEDRDKWYKILTKLDIKQPPGDMVTSEESAIKVANTLGYPVMVRPSFVLGGRAMEIVYGYALLTSLMYTVVARQSCVRGGSAEDAVLLDSTDDAPAL